MYNLAETQPKNLIQKVFLKNTGPNTHLDPRVPVPVSVIWLLKVPELGYYFGGTKKKSLRLWIRHSCRTSHEIKKKQRLKVYAAVVFEC